MNCEERKVFWQVLCSLTGTDSSSEGEYLQSFIKIPKFLFRYRTASDKPIEALKTNRLYFSRADYFDDPFDTLIKVDVNVVKQRVMEAMLPDNVKAAIDVITKDFGIGSREHLMAEAFLKNIDAESGAALLIEYLVQQARYIWKQRTWATCFCESGINETMWLKYADNYQGFCLVYDLDDDTKRHCGKKEICGSCAVNNAGVNLYPMYYSDDKYDATDYMAYLAISDLMQKYFSPDKASELVEKFPNMLWQRERIALIKAKCHEYDQEWRMILRINNTEGTYYQEWVPYGVILGLRITPENKERVIQSARIAGINRVFETFIDADNKLGLRTLA